MVGTKVNFKSIKMKPLKGSKKRRKIKRKVLRKIKKAFPLATQPLR